MGSRLYEVEFTDVTAETLAANVIADNILSQIDDEVRRQLVIYEIFDLSYDQTKAVTKENGYIRSSNETMNRVMIIKG